MVIVTTPGNVDDEEEAVWDFGDLPARPSSGGGQQ